jgi:hypothetical protein
MLEIETLKASLPPDGALIDFVLVSNFLAWPGVAPSAYRLVALQNEMWDYLFATLPDVTKAASNVSSGGIS